MDFNPFQPGFFDDPYPAYARLRATDPVHWSELLGAWVVTRYEDVERVLRDARFSAVRSTEPPTARGLDTGPLTRMVSREILLVRDPPDHTRLRALVSQPFTRSRTEKLRERAAAVARELLAHLEPKHECDLVAEFAAPLPLAVIANLLGVPERDMPVFRCWAQDLSALMDPARLVVPEARVAAEHALEEAQRYFDGLFAERARHPADDLLTALVQASLGEDRLSRDELFAMCVLILIAGYETTANLLGIAAMMLLSRGDDLSALRADPTLVPGAIEEVLRFEAIAQFTGRVASEDLKLGEREIARGDTVLAAIGAANRDPAVFAAPDLFDIRRSPNPHLAFGLGRHFCLGASLARMEAAEGIAALLPLADRVRLADARPRWKASTLHGLSELRVIIG